MSVEFFGITIGDDGNGFIIPTFQALRGAVAGLLRQLRGIANLNTEPSSYIGNIVDGITVPFDVALQNAAQAVAATLFTSARGVNLDKVVEPFTTRLPATASTADLTLYGAPGTIIAANSQARANPVSTAFATDAATPALPAIGASDNYVIEVAPFDFSVEIGNTFTLTVDGTPFVVAVGFGATADTVVANLIALVNAGGLSQVASAGGTNPANSRVGARIAEGQGLGPFPISFVYSGGSPLEFLFPAVQQASTAVETGAIAAPTLALREIVTPIVGWEGVFNSNAAVLGREIESDSSLRARHRAQIKGAGASNPDAIRARCLLPIEQGGGGATSCTVEYNKTDIVDANGNLPHSIRVVVNEDVDQNEVAQAIWDTRSAGDNMNGAVQIFVSDSEGNPQEVLFDLLQNIFIWVQGIVAPGEGFSNVGDPIAAIRLDTANYVEGLPSGRDVNPIQLPIEYTQTGEDNGIAEYDIQIGFSLTAIGPPIFNLPFYPSGTPSATAATQPILPRQRARGDVSRVTLVTP